MAKQVCASDADSKLVDKSFLIDTSLQTHLAVMVSSADTVYDLKNKIQYEHPLCFPNIGKVKIEAIKVKRRGHFYHLSDSMVLGIAFDGFSKKSWFAYVDVSVLPHEAPTHHFIPLDSSINNTSNAVVSHSPRDHPTNLSNFDKGPEPSTYDRDQILLDASNPEKQVHSVMDYEVPSVGTRCETDESGRVRNVAQLKIYVKETENVVSFAKKKHNVNHIKNASGNLPKEILQLNASSTPVAARETVTDDNGIKKEALSVKNTHDVDGDVEEHPHAKPNNIGEKFRASADENNIINHDQQVGTDNGNDAGEVKKTAQKQDSKSILSEVIKPSDEYDSDARIKRSSTFSKGSDINVTLEPKTASRRRRKKQTKDRSGAMLDGTVEGCAIKGEDVLTEFGNLGDLGQSTKIGDEQKEFFPERQEENVIGREVIPAEDKERDVAKQKGNLNEKNDGGLEQLSKFHEIVEDEDKIKKSKRRHCSESKTSDNLRKDGRIGDNLSEDHHTQSLVEASKSKSILGKNRRFHTVQASEPKLDHKLEAILVPHSNLETSTKLPRKHKCQNHQLSLDKFKPIKKAFGSVVGLNNTGQKKSLLASSGPIFKDDSSDSLEDQDQSYHSNRSTRTPLENSLSSAYSDGESNADSLLGKGRENGESLARADLSDKKAVTIENVLRSSKRYKKAKLMASQMEDTEDQPPEFVPDSQADV